MNIKTQIEFLRNYFNTKNIIDNSTQQKMSNVECEKIRKIIKTNKKDGEHNINNNFTVKFQSGKVLIVDTE